MSNTLPLYLGGTIGCVKTGTGLKPGLTFEEVMAKAGVKKTFPAAITPFGKHGIDSSQIDVKMINTIIKTIKETHLPYDDILIVSGTDTLAWLGSFLSYGIRYIDKPIVLTGAQNPIEEANSDGIKNLNLAIKTLEERRPGISLAFCDKAMPGGSSTKVDSSDVNGFIGFKCASANIDSERRPVEFFHQFSDSIAVIYMHPGLDSKHIRAAADGKHGVLFLNYGAGGAPRDIWATLEALSLSKVVVAKSQCLYGETNTQKYAASGNVVSSVDPTIESCYAKMSYQIGKNLADHNLQSPL